MTFLQLSIVWIYLNHASLMANQFEQKHQQQQLQQQTIPDSLGLQNNLQSSESVSKHIQYQKQVTGQL